MKSIYYVEVTDTFGGEANYTWVRRFKVHANTMRGAMRKVASTMGFGGVRQCWSNGFESHWNWRDAHICASVEEYENQAEHWCGVVSI